MSFTSATVTASVPASSANLGPGFDSFGIAHDIRDTLTARVHDGPLVIDVSGEGAQFVPRDERHLVWRAMLATFAALGVQAPGVHLTCRNTIPHSRGMGSSSAAIVGGIALARGLVEGASMSDAEALDLANQLEGHPDNVAPAQLGGFTIAGTEGEHVVVARLDVAPTIAGVLFVPTQALSTKVARGLLPEMVSHRDAAANSGRAALLVAALAGRPELLLAGTHDWLHQEQRRPAMPSSLALIDSLRADRIAATVSGAGPTVLALVPAGTETEVAKRAPEGWATYTPKIGVDGVHVTRS